MESDKKERELDKKEAAANRAADITDKEELQRQCKRDKQDFLEFQAYVLTQELPQRSMHQLTDAAAHDNSHTPTGRQPHGGDATSTNPSDGSGVGRSL